MLTIWGLYLFIPLFIILIILEGIYLWYQNCLSLKDTFTNLTLSIMYLISDLCFTLLMIKTAYLWCFEHGFKLFYTTNLTNFVVLFIAQDFLYYWFHRIFHRVRFGWAAHVTHHSSTHLNFSTSLRQNLTYPLSGMWLFWLPLTFIGFNPNAVLLIVALNLAFQFFIHTQILDKFKGKFRFIELIFNTPSHHRAHHAINSQYINKNFAGVFIIWDKFFGTFICETEKPEYGIVHPVKSHNPLTLTFHEWVSLFHDIKKTKDIRHLWMPPGWNQKSHDTT